MEKSSRVCRSGHPFNGDRTVSKQDHYSFVNSDFSKLYTFRSVPIYTRCHFLCYATYFRRQCCNL